MNKPICKQCEEAGKKCSITILTDGMTTCMGVYPGYWDEDGIYHAPYDPNYVTYKYCCSNGHTWMRTDFRDKTK
jgi:hypothetical protein